MAPGSCGVEPLVWVTVASAARQRSSCTLFVSSAINRSWSTGTDITQPSMVRYSRVMTERDRELWQELAEKEARGAVRAHTSPGGIKYEPVYFSAEETPEPPVPGQFPYTRGVKASMYLGRPWTVRQYAGFSTAEESNAFYKSCLERGQRGLSVAFDLPTHRGYDSDHPRARGDVGKAGVAIDSVEDMKVLFGEIDLTSVSVSMTMNGAVLPILAAFIVAAEEQGVSKSDLKGTIQNDILKEFLVRNTYIYPPEASMRIVRDVIAFCSEEMPRFNPISISGYHLQEAGASVELELAYTLANGLEYVRQVVESGLDVDSFAPRLSFFFGVGMDFFLEVAKLRAARQLWATLLKERFSPQNPNSLRLRTHCQTSGVSLTAQRPHNNIVRTTVEAMAAILGGTQSLHTNSFDEALALPSDAAARVARDTQLILREETDLAATVDPLAGCYLVEDLTNKLVDRVRCLLSEIEEAGGMVRAIEKGVPQGRIAQAAAMHKAEVDSGSRPILGVNLYPEELSTGLDVRIIEDAPVLAAQSARLKAVRKNRDEVALKDALSALRFAAENQGSNLLAAALGCMRHRATVGEVSAVLEEVFGRHKATSEVASGVYGAAMSSRSDWEEIRAQVANCAEKEGRRPRILIAKVGMDGHDRGAKVVASGLADAGFDVELGPLFQSPLEVAQAAIDGDAQVVGISTHAGGHRVLVSDLLQALVKLGGQDVLVVCGGIIPQADHAELRRLGVAAVFEPGASLTNIASELLDLVEKREA